jgi:FKBP-type peptidyl-prolyl cis-trans isomerase
MMKFILTTAMAFALIVSPTFSSAEEAAPADDNQKTFYALGFLMSGNLKAFDLTPAELKFVQEGLADGASGKEPAVDPNAFRDQLRTISQERSTARAAKEKDAGKAYLAKAAKAPGAETTDSGLIFTSVEAGTGTQPAATDRVKVHYTGKLLDGTVFDSSVERGTPATFPLNGVIPCWTEGVQKMKAGGKATLVCPSDIAYGDRGAPPSIQPGATLIFDVELIEIVAPDKVVTPDPTK